MGRARILLLAASLLAGPALATEGCAGGPGPVPPLACAALGEPVPPGAGTPAARPGPLSRLYHRDPARFRSNLLLAGYLTGLAWYGYQTWWENDRGDFHVEREGWFGQDSYRGGTDKLAHAWLVYTTTRLLTRGFQWTGYPQPRALRKATWTTGLAYLGIEIADGFTKRFGFSPEDLVANAAGLGFAWWSERHPGFDELFDFRVQYLRTDSARRNDETITEDYSGQVYLLVLKLAGVPRFRRHSLLRYLEFSVGYGTRGYQPEDELVPRSRHLYAGIGINLGELLRRKVFHDPARWSRTRRVTETALEFLQVPGTMALSGYRLPDN